MSLFTNLNIFWVNNYIIALIYGLLSSQSPIANT